MREGRKSKSNSDSTVVIETAILICYLEASNFFVDDPWKETSRDLPEGLKVQGIYKKVLFDGLLTFVRMTRAVCRSLTFLDRAERPGPILSLL